MAFRRTYLESEPQRINRWLGGLGVCSRREAEALILAGRVRIDEVVVTEPGRKISQGETLSLSDAEGGGLEPRFTVLIHKPVGIVSAQPEAGEIPAVRLLTAECLQGDAPLIPPTNMSLPALGRLDKDSRGLLILSNDGVLAKAVIGPDSAVDKAYRVRVTGRLTPAKIAQLRQGLSLDGRKLRPTQVMQTGPDGLDFTLTEGRNRQIRRMCALVGLTVIDLLRVRIGPISLAGLEEGHWRMMSATEQEALRSWPSSPPSSV